MNRKILITVTLCAALLVILSAACTKRFNPEDPELLSGDTFVEANYDSSLFWENVFGNLSWREISVYTPPGYDPTDWNVRYPTLYLLHGYGGDNDFYSDYFGLKEIADYMISAGEIQPMLIVTPDGSSSLGGGFYTDTDSAFTRVDIDSVWNYISWDSLGTPTGSLLVLDTLYTEVTYGGKFETYIWRDVIEHVENSFTAVSGPWWEYFNYDVNNVPQDSTYHDVDARLYRAIGGHSMGGYGAMKIALRHPELYSSVSSMSAPLAFVGSPDDGFYGLLELVPSMLAENGITTLDSINYYQLAPDETRPLTSMMFAMASVFSPHDMFSPDTTYFHRLDPSYWVGVDLPFGYDYSATEHNVNQDIWAKWLAEDVTSMLMANPTQYVGALTQYPLSFYIDSGDEDPLVMGHAEVFDGVLNALGIEHDPPIIYSGYSDLPAGHVEYLADRLKEVLKFHSDHFPDTN